METGICSHLREQTESNVDSNIPEAGDKGETLDVNADNLTVGGANEFSIEWEAVFSLESSIHQLLCHNASATVTERKQSFNDACGDDFPSESAPHCTGSDMRERYFNIGSNVEDGGDCSVTHARTRLWKQRTQGPW